MVVRWYHVYLTVLTGVSLLLAYELWFSDGLPAEDVVDLKEVRCGSFLMLFSWETRSFPDDFYGLQPNWACV